MDTGNPFSFNGSIAEYCDQPFCADDIKALFDLNSYFSYARNKLSFLFALVMTVPVGIWITSYISLDYQSAGNAFLAIVYGYIALMVFVILWAPTRYYLGVHLDKKNPFSLSIGTTILSGHDRRSASDFKEYPIDPEVFENIPRAKLLTDNIALQGRKPVYFEYLLLKKIASSCV